ncbi:hypothetical protein [Acetobacter indonesiensis]|jgi:hypothetical protein|uniref:hypothetical protein n=1 Tax=Acetobacter indonesiensis TaxID=104101 RepID=UPI0020A468B5|nr:hypothetical protein [Acetobacter indonesiensis]MCP1232230.1 hypothetical protein [Acetobacter indonesiensis]
MVEWGRDTPWRQGHLVSDEGISVLGMRSAGDSDTSTALVIATHDCDLAQASDSEPYVEVMVGRFISREDVDGNFTHAKNARKLHVEFTGSNSSVWVQMEATSKEKASKDMFSGLSPQTELRLSPENYAIFQMWLASRYRRSAFPDEFERRLTRNTKLADKISKILRPLGDQIVGIFFDVDDGIEITREGPDDTYTLDITILHAVEPDFDTAEKAAEKAVQNLESEFQKKCYDAETGRWKEIELRFCTAISEGALNYSEFKTLKKWRLDHISLAASPQHNILADG